MSCHFNVFQSDISLRLQIELIDDDEKFTCQSPQVSTLTAAILALLEKANARIEERRRLVSRYPLGKLNSRSNTSNPLEAVGEGARLSEEIYVL
jgi:hypothetical protein